MELERIIREELATFIQSHVPAADLSGMDEVFFSYATSVLEELGRPESAEENFDMETFLEMMEAYVPGFADINSGEVCEMMFSLSGRLCEARSKQTTSQNPVQNRSCEAQIATKEEGAGTAEDNRLLYSPIGGAPAQEASRPEKSPKQDEFKQFILQKYMMVDSEEDQKTHKPAPPKEAPKKLIRYIDNQVVSTKGERYKDIRKLESEEMKRTYINLKPARKYKFH